MQRAGTYLPDPVMEHEQVDWMLVSVSECPNSEAEEYFIRTYFRVPHEPYGPRGAFVRPVEVRRTRNWVLFRQVSGILY